MQEIRIPQYPYNICIPEGCQILATTYMNIDYDPEGIADIRIRTFSSFDPEGIADIRIRTFSSFDPGRDRRY
jgi:hypothetical protein